MDAVAEARFVELRSLLHRAPSANAWQLASAHTTRWPAQGATLARTTAHAPIEALQLTIGRVDDAALLALLDAPWGASLSALVLRSTQVGAECLRAPGWDGH